MFLTFLIAVTIISAVALDMYEKRSKRTCLHCKRRGTRYNRLHKMCDKTWLCTICVENTLINFEYLEF